MKAALKARSALAMMAQSLIDEVRGDQATKPTVEARIDENGKGVRDLMPLLQVDPNHSAEARAAFEQALGRRALRIKRNALGSGHNLDPSWEWNIADEVGGGGAGGRDEGGGEREEGQPVLANE